MKTINKIQKTVLTTVVTTGLVVAGLSVDSQVAGKMHFENNEGRSFAMIEGSSNHFYAANAEFSKGMNEYSNYASYLVVDIEEPLHLEDWMTESFNTPAASLMETETDSPMEVEGWMKDESNFEVNSLYHENATEEALEIENWMLDENNFKTENKTKTQKTEGKTFSTEKYIINLNFKPATDNALNVEDWMLNSPAWK